MALLASIVAGAVTLGTYTIWPALVYVLWSDIAAPVTVWLLAWAGVGLFVDHLVLSDRRMKPYEGLAIGGATGAFLALRGRLPMPSSLGGVA